MTSFIDTAYPLHWPEGRPRTSKPQRSRFSTTFACARDNLLSEIKRLGGWYPTISTNVNLRRDGLPYANRPEPDDKGVAVYFELKGKPQCIPCDKWDRVGDNIHAIAKSIEAMRGLERWGGSDIMNQAFSGFQMLPGGTTPSWATVLGVSRDDHHDTIKTNYRLLAKEHHPDHGGDPRKFNEVQQAWEDYQVQEGPK